MPQGLNEIKRRIKSVNSTKQITKAMELVSTAKLKKARTRLDKSKIYFHTVTSSINDVLAETKGMNHPFLKQREIKKSLYILITSDKGLAGGYNSNVCKEIEADIENKENTEIIAIGNKGRDYLRRRGYKVIESYNGVSESPQFADALNIGNKVMKMYRDQEIDEIKIVYTEFKSNISFVPRVQKILPASADDFEEKESKVSSLIEFEPSPEGVLEYLIPKYVNSVIFGNLIESSVAESGSRRMAMENATDNAEELLGELELHYNRARQAAITQEITEIVGGAEALS